MARQFNVFKRGKILYQIIELENKANRVPPVCCERFAVIFFNMFAVQHNFAASAAIHAAKYIQKRCFARARRPDYDAKFAFLYFKINAGQRLYGYLSAMVFLGNVFKRQIRHTFSHLLKPYTTILPHKPR